jgi:integrase
LEADAEAFDARVNEHGRGVRRATNSRRRAAALDRVADLTAERATQDARDGVYPYATNAGVRWRFLYRQSDGTLSSRRGFASRTAALAARRRLRESIARGEVKVSRETFETFWSRYVADKRPYMTPGSHLDLTTHGRKRLVPFFGSDPLSRIDEDRVRDWLGTMVELVEANELAPKTVNNARTSLSVLFNEAVRRGLMVRNPCVGVPALPLEQDEIEYLRLAEIVSYVDGCADHYRPLAEFLIGTGARVSEAVATRWADLELQQGVVRIYRQRARGSDGTRTTKGKRSRSVQIGPRLRETLRGVRTGRLAQGVDDGGWIFLCPTPRRGRYAARTKPLPPHRKTVHDWHEAALQDAGLRDMPLHSLRHTAAAAWLAVGHPLIFVQRQLGHRSITTTEEHYGHLEGSFVKDAAARTEAAIAAACRMVVAAEASRDSPLM